MENNKKLSIFSLTPMLLFILIYLGSGLLTGNLKSMPVEVAFLISAIVALFMNREEKFTTKVEIFCRGGGNSNIILMSFIFILASAFSQITKEMGAVHSVVNFGLSFLSSKTLIPTIFVISCFLSLAIGTSVGTIVSLTPIALGVAEASGNSLGLCCAAVLGGAMFGDNLSIISDTTIVATKTQGCEMKDKFKANFKLVILPAVMSMILFYFSSNASSNVSVDKLAQGYSFIKMCPYILVLITALAGLDVFIVLFLGILVSSGIGLFLGDFTMLELIQVMSVGIQKTGKIVIVVITVGGIIELVKHNGGLEYIITSIQKRVKRKRDAELWIGILVLLIDICVGNNTIAVVSAGPIAKEISNQYELEPKIVASILDTFAAGVQGLLPYSNPMLAVLGIATHISALEIIQYNYYNFLMIIVVFLAIFVRSFKVDKNK